MRSLLRVLLPGLFVLTVAGCCGSKHVAPAAAKPDSEDDKVAYAAGYMQGGKVGALKLAPQQMDMAKQGFDDAAAGNPSSVDIVTYEPKVRQLAKDKLAEAAKDVTAKAQAQKDKDQPFRDAAAKETGAETLAGGVVYKSTQDGKGDSPTATSSVKVSYTAKLADGTPIEDTAKRGGAHSFLLTRLVPCMTAGIQKMKAGGKAVITCPSDAAYGDKDFTIPGALGQPAGSTVPGGATVQFEVELVAITASTPVPAASASPSPTPAPTKPGK